MVPSFKALSKLTSVSLRRVVTEDVDCTENRLCGLFAGAAAVAMERENVREVKFAVNVVSELE